MKEELRREIGLWDGILIVINSIVGTGIFFVPQITASISGMASYFVWIFLAWFSVLVSIIFADLVYIFPRAGGVYDYVKSSFNEALGFLAGWIEIIVSWIVVSMIIARVAQEALKYFGIPYIVTVFLILTAFHLIVYRGIRSSKYLLLFFACWTLLTIGLGIYYFSTVPLDEISIKTFTLDPYLILFSLYLAFESYARWENIVFLAEEAKRPKKDIPLALMLGNFITVSLYLILAYFIILAALSYGDIFHLGKLGSFLLFFVLIQSLGTSFAWIVAIPRLLYALSRDNILPEIFSRLNKYKTPTFAILLQYLFILFFALTGSFESLLSILPPTLALLYIIILASYLKIKLQSNEGFVGRNAAIIFTIFSLPIFFIVFFLGGLRTLMGVLLSLVALPIYFGTNMHKFVQVTRGVHEIFARIIDWFSSFWIKKSYIDEIILYLYPLNNKKILDFGCSTGKLTIRLAKEARDSEIYASDISGAELSILEKKIEKEKLQNVHVFIDIKDRISKRFISFFDAVVSIGALGYIKNRDLFLKDLARALKPGGKFIFIEYDKVFGIFNAPDWIRDEKKLKEEFRRYGLLVRVNKRNDTFWKVIVIYGYKPSKNFSNESIKGQT